MVTAGLVGILLIALSFVVQAGWGKDPVNFASYETPLYEQVITRIKKKVLSRLGEGRNTRDRYFIIPFAFQNKGNDPAVSHSFMTVIRVLADDRQPKLTPGLHKRTIANRKFEAFTISWFPADFAENPNLCVFKGFGSRICPKCNQCRPVEGRSFTLEETLKLAVGFRNAVCMWGPYEITEQGFDLSVARLRLLEKGDIKYLADDRLTRMDHTAINCIRAMAGLNELFPVGGLFGTGFRMWGINGTARVLLEYTSKEDLRDALLEPVDEKSDRFGFVYAAELYGKCYDPFKRSDAYHR